MEYLQKIHCPGIPLLFYDRHDRRRFFKVGHDDILDELIEAGRKPNKFGTS